MPLVAAHALRDFCRRAMIAAGCKESHAETMAIVLTAADVRGVYSHGCNRLEMYVDECLKGVTNVKAEPTLAKETPATAMIHGNNSHGPVVGKYAMEIAIKKAQNVGVGWVTANGSNHYGIAGYYAMMAADHGLIGMSMTNTSPLQVPTRARAATFGTNPIAVAAPGLRGDSFVLDMATSTCPIGKVELAARKNVSIPNGWGVNKLGQETNDPRAVLDDGGLLPLGGGEASAGYKGYGLAFMVELFCGIAGGAAYGPNIRSWRGGSQKQANLGQCFVAVDPNAFADGFEGRMQDMMDTVRRLQPAVGEQEVLSPGDPEKRHTEKQLRDGIQLHSNVVKHLFELGKRLKISPLEVLSHEQHLHSL